MGRVKNGYHVTGIAVVSVKLAFQVITPPTGVQEASCHVHGDVDHTW